MVIKDLSVESDVQVKRWQVSLEFFRRFGQNRESATPNGRKEPRQEDVSLKQSIRQPFSNYQQVPVTIFMSIASRSRSEEDYGYEILPEAASQ